MKAAPGTVVTDGSCTTRSAGTIDPRRAAPAAAHYPIDLQVSEEPCEPVRCGSKTFLSRSSGHTPIHIHISVYTQQHTHSFVKYPFFRKRTRSSVTPFLASRILASVTRLHRQREKLPPVVSSGSPGRCTVKQKLSER